MNKNVWIIGMALGLAACGNDSNNNATAQRPAVTGQLDYTDENQQKIGQLRGADVEELAFTAIGNRPVGGFQAKMKKPFDENQTDLAIDAGFLQNDLSQISNFFLILQPINKNTELACLGESSNLPFSCSPNSGKISFNVQNGQIKWAQQQSKFGSFTQNGQFNTQPEKFIVSHGELISTIDPKALVFQKNRFPIRTTQNINSAAADPITAIDYQAYQQNSPTGTPISQEIELALSTKNNYIRLDILNQKIIEFNFNPCVENCSYQTGKLNGLTSIKFNNAIFKNSNSTALEAQYFSVAFAEHQANLSFKNSQIKTNLFNIAASAANNRAIYNVNPVDNIGDTECNSRHLQITREQQTIQKIEWNCVREKTASTPYSYRTLAACGLPNTPTCQGASISADQHTFTFNRVNLSNQEQINGTLYFAGVSAEDAKP